jgi:putative tryptophan/tyrosine transport system substrate-binding protein
MQRRWFMRLLGAAAFAWPYAARAQQPKKIPRIGVLWHAGNAEEEEVYLTALRKGFRDLGYVEGKNIQLENRFPDEKPREISDTCPRACRQQSRCDYRCGGDRCEGSEAIH